MQLAGRTCPNSLPCETFAILVGEMVRLDRMFRASVVVEMHAFFARIGVRHGWAKVGCAEIA